MKVKVRHLIDGSTTEVEPLDEDAMFEGRKVSEVSITEYVDREKEAETVRKFKRMIEAVEGG